VVKGKEDGMVKRIAQHPNNKQEIILKRGDVIKLGRAILRVRDVKFNGTIQSMGEYQGPYQDERIDFTKTKVIPE
jgi:predicted amidohydrolase